MFQNGACYIRVSTDDQTEFSPDAQLKAILAYAKAHNIVITREHIFIDEGISGRTAEKRPAFMKMVGTAKMNPKPFDIILVHKFDRFARSREDSVVYKSMLRKDVGVKVVSITESLIEDDKFSILIEALLEAMAEYYSINLSEEVKKGMTEKAERGGYQAYAPFGYKMVNKVLEIIPEEAEAIKMIFNDFAYNKIPMRQIAIKLNDMGFKTKRNNPFENRTIDYILNNPVYIGKARWTPTGKANRYRPNPDTIIRDSQHESIIDVETWNIVQEMNRTNNEVYRFGEHKNPKKIRTWLKGLAKCGDCGRAMVSSGRQYMQCNGYNKGQCKESNIINTLRLEKLVLEQLKQAYQGDIKINVVPKTTDYDTKTEYDILVSQLEKITDKEKRIKVAYEDGIDTLEEYKENKLRIANEKDNMQKRLNELKNGLVTDKENSDIIKRMLSVYELLTDETIDMQNKYNTAHFLIERVDFNKKQKILKITYK